MATEIPNLTVPVDAVTPAPSAAQDDPLWYKDAVIYEVHVRAFFDSNDDGVGDFPGLTRKLEYIQDLGVNAIWLLPFYPSPGRDDGYDIADYRNIHPQYGTRGEFRTFVREAHRRGLRVITELVLNHTSEAHPWFQAARRAPPNSTKRNFYLWSATADRYAGTRIIFSDTESSNWAWDPLAKAYYWHRFFSHQPDLNFDNPHVVRALTRIMEFWLANGVDGFRLDAIPYLVEREGTSNENLRETHEIVKLIRKVITDKYPDRMLLAEANQWPEDVRDYFGDGDECHMAYHFPLMPRMYMAIAQEDRHPIVEIMEQTPDIPENCQWAIFLRNHDELTLETVTSRERDYMYQAYAADPRARLNLGIRRRLAPLMENDAERIKLMNGLLLSMPGTPIIYYGESRSQRGLLPRRSAAVVPAPHHGPHLRFPGRERGGADARPLLAAELDEPHAAGAPDIPGLRPRDPALHPPRQPQGVGIPAPVRRGHDPVRRQFVPLGATGRDRPGGAQRRGADRAARPHAVSADR